MTTPTKAKPGEIPSLKPVGTSKTMLQFPLFFVWTGILSAISGYVLVVRFPIAARTLAGGLAFVWVGLILGISFTAAWSKFKAPLIERHVALDVGRHEFTALGSVEAAFATTLVGVLATNTRLFPDHALVIALGLLLIVLFQVFYLTPTLELRIFKAINDALENKSKATRQEEEVFKHVKANMTLKSVPSATFHHVFILLELVKIGLLLKLATDVVN